MSPLVSHVKSVCMYFSLVARQRRLSYCFAERVQRERRISYDAVYIVRGKEERDAEDWILSRNFRFEWGEEMRGKKSCRVGKNFERVGWKLIF